MKTFSFILPFLMAARVAVAGEPALTMTYQPLSGLRSGVIAVVPVVCHHWYATSVGSAVDLIHVRNVPPTDNPASATEDLNLASRGGLKFSTNDLGVAEPVPMILLDATKFDSSKTGYPKEDVIRASLECLRLCVPEQLKSTKITLKCRDEDREWLSKIVTEYDSAPRDKPFFVAVE